MRSYPPHTSCYHCAAKSVNVMATISSTADEEVVVAEEN